jgi:hypothetical protein
VSIYKPTLVALLTTAYIAGTDVPTTAVPIPVSSSLELTARAGADGFNRVVTASNSSQGATLNPLSVSAIAIDVAGPASAQAAGSVVATWANAASGTLRFSLGWTTQQVTSGSVNFFNSLTNPFGEGGAMWRYTFISDRTGLFDLDYDVSRGGPDPFGLLFFSFEFTGFATSMIGEISTLVPLHESGTLTRPVIAGHAYSVALDNISNVVGPLGTRSATLEATFNFSIVPNSPTGLLMAAGAGVVIWRMRRARS